MTNTTAKYNRNVRLLHWISALIILWVSITGFLTATPIMDSATKHHIASFNVSVSTLFMPIFFIRILYRLKHATPAYPQSISKLEIVAAKSMHIILYITISIVLISGFLMMKQDFYFFNTFKIPHLINSTTGQAFFKHIHTFSTIVLATCVSLHIVALLKHEIMGKRILSRMI